MQYQNSSQTEMNLLQAFAGESQANRKYLAFAKQAEKEGYPQAARLFRAAAEAETVHALAHLRALGKIGTTEENLKAAIAGETFEFTEMYPPMIKKAQEEGHAAARKKLHVCQCRRDSACGALSTGPRSDDGGFQGDRLLRLFGLRVHLRR